MSIKTQLKTQSVLIVLLICLLGIAGWRIGQLEHEQQALEDRLDTYYILIKNLYGNDGG